MSYQPLNIVIREAKLTDFLTDLAVIFNTNDTKLKSEIQKIVNGLQINTVTGVVGEPDSTGAIPINEINARTVFIVLPGTPSVGPKFGFRNAYNGPVVAGVDYEATAVEPWTVSFASDVYSMVMGTQSAGYRAYFDKVTVGSVMQALYGRFTSVQLADASGLLDCTAVAQFNGLVIHRSGHKESLVDSPVLMQLDGTTLYGEYVIGRNTPENVFVNLQFHANGYNAGWVAGITDIQLRLAIDPGIPSNLPLPGQSFNFIFRGATDVLNTLITEHPLVDMVIRAKETVPGTPDFEFKNFGANGAVHTIFDEILFIPGTGETGVSTNSLDTYGSSISFIYNRETLPASSPYTQSNMMYVRNRFAKE